MAGSYQHCVNDEGQLYDQGTIAQTLDNGGDVWEAVEELYGMIWYLAGGDALRVEEAERMYRVGIQSSPGYAPSEDDDV